MKSGREKLVESAVRLIARNRGIQGVNMRAVAAHARCAHTNVYNYFESYESLLWAALHRSLEMMVEYVEKRMAESSVKGLDAYENIMTGIIDFSIGHEGLYKLISFEYTFSTPMPENVSLLLMRMNRNMDGFLAAHGGALSDEAVRRRTHDIVFGYVSGGICRLLQNRVQGGRSEENISAVKTNLHFFLKMLSSVNFN